MSHTIVVLATMDTKGEECDWLRQEIERHGARALLVDIGVVGDASLAVDVTAETVAERGGSTLATLRDQPSRETASDVMVRGAIAVLEELVRTGGAQAVVGLGGTQGTANGTRVMQALPYGLPKLMVSTMAAGDTSGYVGIKDITMMFSVSDILGLNPLLRQILSNAAGAAVGMAGSVGTVEMKSERPVVGITNLGVLTQGTMQAMALLAERGYETMVFHAVGSGGRAMEQLMRDGLIGAVLDYALGDIVDALFGGIRAADRQRLTVASALGLPQVIVPGGTDHIGILLDEPNVVPERWRDRPVTFHNPSILVPRTTGAELEAFTAELATRLSNAPGNARFLLPTAGLSSYSVAGAPLFDAVSDAAFFAAVRTRIPEHVTLIEVDAPAEDARFVRRAVDTLVELIESEV